MKILRAMNLALRFLLELSAAGILSWWGFAVGRAGWGVLLGVGLPFLAAVVWTLLVAPRSPVPGGRRTRLIAEAAVFLAATLALVGLGRRGWALLFAIAYALNRILVHEWHQDPWERRRLPAGGPPRAPGIPQA